MSLRSKKSRSAPFWRPSEREETQAKAYGELMKRTKEANLIAHSEGNKKAAGAGHCRGVARRTVGYEG